MLFLYASSYMTGSTVQCLACRSCGEYYERNLEEFPCKECGGVLDVVYDYSKVSADRDDWRERAGMWSYRELLPVQDTDAIVSMEEGGTPLVECPHLADELGVGRLLVKDEGRNPTNAFKDRGASVTVSVANEFGVEEIGLPSSGNAGQAYAAYGPRADMTTHVYLNRPPSHETREGDVRHDLIRAHGADVVVYEGHRAGRSEAFERARSEEGWYSVKAIENPYRLEGKKTMGFEIAEALDWQAPDHLVYPTGGGVGLLGIWKAYNELAELDWLRGEAPKIYVSQSTGNAPLVRAIKQGATKHEAWEDPDTVALGIGGPDPMAGPILLDAVYESGGGGVAVPDEEGIDAALQMARTDGVEMCIEAGVALAGAIRLAEEDTFDSDDEVVVVNTAAGAKTHTQFDGHAE